MGNLIVCLTDYEVLNSNPNINEPGKKACSRWENIGRRLANIAYFDIKTNTWLRNTTKVKDSINYIKS